MTETDDGIKLAAETSGAVVKALAEESGVLEPAREYSEYIKSIIHYRHYPRLVARAIGAAKKIEESGLPRRAFTEVPDPLLRAILVSAAEEDEPTMQERWENLLANALTDDSADVKRAFPNVLRELEPVEAALLDRFADTATEETVRTTRFRIADAEIGLAGLDNLVRLNLLEYARSTPTLLGSINIDRSNISEVMFTDFGWSFVQACRSPKPMLPV